MTNASNTLKLLIGASAFALFAATATAQESDDESIFDQFPGMGQEADEEELMEELGEDAEEQAQDAEDELAEALEEEGGEAEDELMETLDEQVEDAEDELMETLGEAEDELMESLDEADAELQESGAGSDDAEGDLAETLDAVLPDTDVTTAGLVPVDPMMSEAAIDSAAGVDCPTDGTCVVDATGQPLRILPRAFAALYASPDADADVLSNAVSAFKPAFVFDRQGVDLSDNTDPQGWYQVGYSQRSPIGWMKAADVVEWRQALLLEYIHPGTGSDKRTPVVMFRSKDAVADLVTGGGRANKVDSLLEGIDGGDKPEGVIGREPAEFLNINDSFYLLPIIQWEREEGFDEPSHYLQIFAAVPGERAEEAGEGTIEDEDFLSETLTALPEDTEVDVVFVMDMTGSMQPYMDRVKDGVASVAAALDGAEDVDFRFGLVGYRDSTEVTPELEWTTKNFTPELVSAESFTDILTNDAKAAKVSSDEWAEDVHGGYLEGINSAWRKTEGKRQMRFIILVGDASGHDYTDERKREKNSAEMTEEALVNLARGKDIYSLGLYLQDDRAERDWDKGVSQFGRLAALPNNRGEGVVPVDADAAQDEQAGINATTQFVGLALIDFITADMDERRAMVDDVTPTDEIIDTDGASEDTLKSIEVARGVLQAGMVDWLGDGARPPKDFVSWTFDQDLKDISRPALAVRVMMTREQLDNVIRQSESLLDALDNNILGQVDFLTSLKLASAQTSLGLEVDPDLSLGDQEFLPKWVAALPYRSRVLGMTPAEFTNLSASERIEFRASLESKYNSYREIATTSDAWIKLDEGDTELQEVTSIPLSLLP